jgi:FMN phosphatase YigB (HAD superfamily)
MKYNTVLFDWGDTLCQPHPTLHWDMYPWAVDMIKKLYHASYRLGIISNTHRYQDGAWIRTNLANKGVLQYFEAIISSATYGVHKPDMAIFKKMIDFLQVDPIRCVMVGDAPQADGGCQYFKMKYLKVEPKTKWDQSLYDLLGDSFPSHRKLTYLSEFVIVGECLVTKVRHMSEAVSVGDTLLAGGDE